MAIGKKTGGRRPGGLNKRTLALEAKAKEAAQKIETALGGKAFDGDSHALLMAVYKNVDYPMELRMDAAKAAMRFAGWPVSFSLFLDRRACGLPNGFWQGQAYALSSQSLPGSII